MRRMPLQDPEQTPSPPERHRRGGAIPVTPPEEDPLRCADCDALMEFAGCEKQPLECRPAPGPWTASEGPFWVRCTKCGDSVLWEEARWKDLVERERRAAADAKMGPLERTLRAWGVPLPHTR